MANQSEILLKVENISKKFCRNNRLSVKYSLQDIWRAIWNKKISTKLRREEFWSLNKISFQLCRGDCLAIIGSNGAGKSTLLKIISAIIKPEEGFVQVTGRITSLLEVTSGFHPELSGRENIQLKAAIMGLDKVEIESKVDSIIAFSGLVESIDMPVKNFSSGMNSRLGFAIAAHIKADVLLLDEVFAVGDREFRAQCLRYLDSIRRDTAIVFVSHNLVQVSRLCNKGLYIENGKVNFFGDVDEAISAYKADHTIEKKPEYNFSAAVKSMSVNLINDVSQHEDLKLALSIETHGLKECCIALIIRDKDDNICFSNISPLATVSDGLNEINVEISNILLMPAKYSVTVNVLDKTQLAYHAIAENIQSFMITGGHSHVGVYKQPIKWFS